jgi:hypothetical protein
MNPNGSIFSDELMHHGIKGQKWGVRRYQNKDGSYTPEGARRRQDSEYDEERERHEREVAARRGVEYVRKTKKEREAEDAEEERKEKERRAKEDNAYKRSEERMNKIDEKIRSKYKFDSDADYEKYYKEYDEEWFKILYEERKKEGLSHADMTADELYHFGIKGQKWGVRRYQNKDGSLTAEGKRRYGDVTPDEFNKKRADERAGDVKRMKGVKSALDGARGDAAAIERYANDKYSKKQAAAAKAQEDKIREKVYKMSDDELKAAVNRLNMEERYTQVMQSREYIDTGRTVTEKFMGSAATALTMTSTALTVAMMIRELQK